MSRNALRRGDVGDTMAVSRSGDEADAAPSPLTARLSSVVVFRLPVSITGSGGYSVTSRHFILKVASLSSIASYKCLLNVFTPLP